MTKARIFKWNLSLLKIDENSELLAYEVIFRWATQEQDLFPARTWRHGLANQLEVKWQFPNREHTQIKRQKTQILLEWMCYIYQFFKYWLSSYNTPGRIKHTHHIDTHTYFISFNLTQLQRFTRVTTTHLYVYVQTYTPWLFASLNTFNNWES